MTLARTLIRSPRAGNSQWGPYKVEARVVTAQCMARLVPKAAWSWVEHAGETRTISGHCESSFHGCTRLSRFRAFEQLNRLIMVHLNASALKVEKTEPILGMQMTLVSRLSIKNGSFKHVQIVAENTTLKKLCNLVPIDKHVGWCEVCARGCLTVRAQNHDRQPAAIAERHAACQAQPYGKRAHGLFCCHAVFLDNQ